MVVSDGLDAPAELMGTCKSRTPRPILPNRGKPSFFKRVRDAVVGAHYFTIKPADRPRLIVKYQYDANETMWNLLSFYGTAIEYIFWKPLTWICIGLHYFGFFYMQSLRGSCDEPGDCWVDHFTSAYSIQSTDITIFTTLVVFLFVSYNNMCYQILQKQYFSSQLICGRITSLAMQLRAVLKNPPHRWNLQRYILAAQNVFYWNLRKSNAEIHGFLPEDKEHPGTWEHMCTASFIPHNLLTLEEAEHLGKYKGNKCTLLLSWFERSLRKMMQTPPPAGEKGISLLETEHDKMSFERTLVDHILTIKSQFASTLEVQQLKVPFSYYHLTYLLLLISLVLLAYAFCFINDTKGNPVSLIIYPSIVIVLSGLQEQANRMSDPFGEDEDDLNVAGFLIASLDECRNLCFAPEMDDGAAAADPLSPGVKEERNYALELIARAQPPPPPPAAAGSISRVAPEGQGPRGPAAVPGAGASSSESPNSDMVVELDSDGNSPVMRSGQVRPDQ